MAKRKKTPLDEYRDTSDRHVVILEADMPYNDILRVIRISYRTRKAGNELVALMRKNLEQLMRTKRYRKLLEIYGNLKETEKRLKESESKTKDSKLKKVTKELKNIIKQLDEMQKSYNVTKEFCRKSMESIYKKYKIHSVFGLTKSEDIWKGVHECLYGSGKHLHFSKYDDLSSLRAKQINRAIIISEKDNSLAFSLNNSGSDKIKFGIKATDRFQNDEIDAILYYLRNSKEIDEITATKYSQGEHCDDTYRPCYATIVPKIIRGKYRIFVHITTEGRAKPKYDKNGNPRHKYGTGKVGIDIGTQTIAITTDSEVNLKNLAERGRSIQHSERQERLAYRAMDRSRRAMNPENYNDDGTIKKGKKVWIDSNNYKKRRARHANLCRKNATNRQLAINQEVNRLRSIADEVVTEPKNAAKLMKSAKETTKNAKGKFNKKKRFGKSIKNRCPGGFQEAIKKKFELTGGRYTEVNNDYRASQYDHTADEYVKKKLSDRLYKLRDGTQVQRDTYSSFLLYCYNDKTQMIDKDKCNKKFNEYYEKQEALIAHIKDNKLKILNSGIKVA